MALARMMRVAVLAFGALVGAAGTLAQVAEVEPNGTTVQADASPVQVMGQTRITGQINPSGDVDIFRVTVGLGQVWRFEMFDSSGSDCVGLAAMTIKLLDATGVQLKTDSPPSGTTASGIGNCPALCVYLDPGIYYIRIDKATSGTIAAYVLDCVPLTNLGIELEPNDTPAAATPVSGSQVFIFGGHMVGSDSDYYAVTIPGGASIRAEVIEGDAGTSCESNLIDSFLTLYAPGGVTVLASDDDDGRGFCSAIDGTGASPRDAGAHNLAVGQYFLQVKASPSATPPANQFNYRLVLSIVLPPGTPAGACCVSGGCSVVVPASCGGVFQGGGTVCSPNPCPVPSGACCDAQTGGCTILASSACGGAYLGDGTVCSPNPCPIPNGACCNSQTGGCSITASGSCGGVFQGGGTVCSPNPCPIPNGACCNSLTGSCGITAATACGGVFQGGGTVCSPSPCPIPNGACCTPAGVCSVVAPASCGGVFQGGGTVCAPNPCPIPDGACCSGQTNGCAVTSPATCTTLGGTFQGGLTVCLPNPCVAPVGACCTGTACAAASPAACAGAGQLFQGIGAVCVPKVTCCPANFDRNATVDVQDIFGFLAAWFAGCP